MSKNKRFYPSQPESRPSRLSRRQWLAYLHAAGMAGIAGCCLSGCRSAPMTGRRQLMLLPESQEMSLGLQAYDEIIESEPASQNMGLVQLVAQVGRRIADVAERPDFDWEFRLIASTTQNAFCLPGGKVAVYEGILPVCQNEAGLAVVMAHEVAHALARHGGERMSQSIFNDNAKQVVGKLIKQNVPDKSELLMQAYGVASKYGVLLPYSRKQESEADHIGVMLMAEAGYDPNEAPSFWQRFGAMAAAKQVQPEFMSTHPSDARRAADLMALMGEAQQVYGNTPKKFGRGQTITRSDRA